MPLLSLIFILDSQFVKMGDSRSIETTFPVDLSRIDSSDVTDSDASSAGQLAVVENVRTGQTFGVRFSGRVNDPVRRFRASSFRCRRVREQAEGHNLSAVESCSSDSRTSTPTRSRTVSLPTETDVGSDDIVPAVAGELGRVRSTLKRTADQVTAGESNYLSRGRRLLMDSLTCRDTHATTSRVEFYTTQSYSGESPSLLGRESFVQMQTALRLSILRMYFMTSLYFHSHNRN